MSMEVSKWARLEKRNTPLFINAVLITNHRGLFIPLILPVYAKSKEARQRGTEN